MGTPVGEQLQDGQLGAELLVPRSPTARASRSRGTLWRLNRSVLPTNAHTSRRRSSKKVGPGARSEDLCEEPDARLMVCGSPLSLVHGNGFPHSDPGLTTSCT